MKGLQGPGLQCGRDDRSRVHQGNSIDGAQAVLNTEEGLKHGWGFVLVGKAICDGTKEGFVGHMEANIHPRDYFLGDGRCEDDRGRSHGMGIKVLIIVAWVVQQLGG